VPNKRQRAEGDVQPDRPAAGEQRSLNNAAIPHADYGNEARTPARPPQKHRMRLLNRRRVTKCKTRAAGGSETGLVKSILSRVNDIVVEVEKQVGFLKAANGPRPTLLKFAIKCAACAARCWRQAREWDAEAERVAKNWKN